MEYNTKLKKNRKSARRILEEKMIKFISLGKSVDSEDLLEYVNRYMMLKDNNVGNTDIYLPIMVENMERLVRETNQLYQINSDVSTESDKKVKRLIKRVIKKLGNWYISIIVNQQIEYNASVVRSLNEQMEIIKILCDRNVALEDEINKLMITLQKNDRGEQKYE